jgi:acyl-CoA synthetase (AMP-forming)/AMP-acid ligase II
MGQRALLPKIEELLPNRAWGPGNTATGKPAYGQCRERWSQRAAAFIRRVGAVDAKALDGSCREMRLADSTRPRGYVPVAEVPKPAAGKVLRRLFVAGDYRRE